jgi:hypothetical protein
MRRALRESLLAVGQLWRSLQIFGRVAALLKTHGSASVSRSSKSVRLGAVIRAFDSRNRRRARRISIMTSTHIEGLYRFH